MSTAFSSLEASVAQIYETNEDLITKDGSDLVEFPNIPGIVGLNVKLIYKTQSLAQMKLDLQMALGVPNDETTAIDIIADNYTLFMNSALSKQQLYQLYRRMDEGEGSLTWARKNEYLKQYNELKAKFNQLDKNSNNTNVVIHQVEAKLWL